MKGDRLHYYQLIYYTDIDTLVASHREVEVLTHSPGGDQLKELSTGTFFNTSHGRLNVISNLSSIDPNVVGVWILLAEPISPSFSIDLANTLKDLLYQHTEEEVEKLKMRRTLRRTNVGIFAQEPKWKMNGSEQITYSS